MKKHSIPQIKTMHLAVRLFLFAFLLWETFSTKASAFGVPVNGYIPQAIIGGYAVIDLILILAFSSFVFAEPALIFFDLLFGIGFLFLYDGSFSFSAPLYLATYAAATGSWPGALGAAFGGTAIFAGATVYLHGLDIDSLRHPTWFFVLLINLLVATIGLLKSESRKQADKMNSLVSLLEVGQQLGSTLTYDHVFNLTFQVARNLFSSNTCAIFLKDGDGIMKLRGVESPYPKLFHDFDPKVAKSTLAQMIAEKRPESFDDIADLSEEEEQIIPKAKTIRAGMAAPLVSEGESLGIIFVAGNTPGAYDGDALKLFTILANQTTISVRNVQLHEKTATMAITDSVSGLFTHGYMQEALEREFRRCKYANLPISTIILDVDHFKIVNDTYGHPQGDALLRQLGSVIKTVTRGTDIVCRYGGDEFMIILPETNRIGAVLVAERVRQTVEEYEFVLGSKIVHITISGGVASFPEDIETKKDLIDKTDQALYKSKNAGRNKISFST